MDLDLSFDVILKRLSRTHGHYCGKQCRRGCGYGVDMKVNEDTVVSMHINVNIDIDVNVVVVQIWMRTQKNGRVHVDK